MANGKREEKSTLGKIADSVKDFFGGAANDFAVGVGAKPATPGHRLRTAKTVAAINARNAASSGDDNSSLAQSNRAAAQRAAMSIGAVGAAPSVPDPNAIGATEQALLDAQKTGRSSTIATSAAGLLSDEDSTRKKRSLMSGLLT